MLPGETLLFRWVLCIVFAAAAAAASARLEAQDYVDNGDNRNQVVSKPTDKLRDQLLNGQVRQTNKMEEEWDGFRFPMGVRPLAKSLVQPSAGFVQRPPVELDEQRLQLRLVHQQQQQTGSGGHFVQQSGEKRDPSPEPNPTGKQESQSMAPANALVKFEPHVPLSAQSVVVRCAEKEVTAEVKRNFLGNGQRVTPSDLKLGGCAAVDVTAEILLFRSELHNCGSTKMMTEESLLYSFSLVYVPTAIGTTSIIKTNAAQVEIQCHYPRKLLVSSDGVRPSWTRHASIALAEQKLHFSLRLMTEDWQHERPSGPYLLGDAVRIEATVQRAHHVPLRVYVDHCLVTLEPHADAQPSYHFISNHGCLTDAKVTGGRSFFKGRSREEMLQFQLQTFRFPQDPRATMFITCYLRATTVPMATDAEHKACSYLTEAKRWVASGGNNQVCSCCETTCSTQKRSRRSSQSLDADSEWEGKAALGPILVQEITPERLVGLPDISGAYSSSLVPQDLEPTLEDWTASTLVLCSVGAGVALLQIVMVLAVFRCRRARQSA